MRVLVAHNAYQQRGGEDMVVDAEVALLREHGHDVELLHRHNDELASLPAAAAAMQTLWSARTGDELRALVRRFRPQVVHVHNTFPLLSPSLYWACAAERIPVVQTLHNFRLACPQAMFLREGRICEDCLGRTPLPALRHACYRNSRPQTAVLVGMLALHRALGTWRDKVAVYIALNEFCRRKFVAAGLPEDRMVVKPNFVASPVPADTHRSGFLFVGRLSEEKGIATLVRAWRQAALDADLLVAGAGPQRDMLDGVPHLTPLGALPLAEVQALMPRSLALVLPSIWYENFPRTLVEAFGAGLPVIASRIGALAELVSDGQTGLLFDAGDASSLATRLAWAQAHPTEMRQMGLRARAVYEAEFAPQRNLEQLLAIYGRASTKSW